jgi:hypothetical protein
MYKKQSPIVFIIIILILIGVIVFLAISNNKRVEAGFVSNNEFYYSNMIINKSYIKNEDVKSIEIKPINDQLNSIIITDKMINDIRNNSELYNKTVAEVYGLSTTSPRDSFNINKAIELKIINNNTSYKNYFVKVTGFNNLNQFLNFCDNAFTLISSDEKLNIQEDK